MSEILLQRTSPLQQLREFESRLSPKEGGGVGAGGFKEMLSEALNRVDEAHKISDTQIQNVLSGDVQDVHTAMIAMQKAELSFQMMMQVRNKLIEAYQEVMRMQV
jgi:flagellar hook-basal body complex protein FliE